MDQWPFCLISWKFVWTNGAESSSKSFPLDCMALVHGWLFPFQKNAFFLQEKPMPTNFLVLGWGILVFGGWGLSGIVSCDAAAILIQIRIVRCQRPAKHQKQNPAKQRPVLLPPLLPVGIQKSVLKMPKRGQFHVAIRVTI